MSESHRLHPNELELQAYFDGELPTSRVQELQAHISHCPECSALVERLAGVAAAIEILQALPYEIDVQERVLATLPAKRDRRGSGLLVLQTLVGVALLAAAVPALLSRLPAPAAWLLPPSLASWGEALAGLLRASWQALQSLPLSIIAPGGLAGMRSWSPPGGAIWLWALGLGLALLSWLRLNRVLLSDVRTNGEASVGA